MLSLRAIISLIDKQACFEKALASCVKKDIIPREDCSSVKPYVRGKFESLCQAIERKEPGAVYELLEEDSAMREFYRVVTGDNVEEMGRKTLRKLLEDTFVRIDPNHPVS